MLQNICKNILDVVTGKRKHFNNILHPRQPREVDGSQTFCNCFIRLHHYQWWRLLFLSVLFFFSLHTKFSWQTRNLYRYGPRMDLRTLTHFQRPWSTFQGHRPIFVPKTRNSNPYNFVIYDRILTKLGWLNDAMLVTYFSVTLTYFFRSNSKSARNILSPVWPKLDVAG